MINIDAYRPTWSLEFRERAQGIRNGLGELALRIDHIGSTAVPGLCAKDIIDIQITVARLGSDEQAQLKKLGYEQHPDILADHVPPGYQELPSDWAKFFFMQPAGQRRMNIHVRQAGKPNQRYALLFRDYLVSHPQVASAYGELKRRLAASLKRDEDYADVKDPAVDLIYFAAQTWASACDWQARPSDA